MIVSQQTQSRPLIWEDVFFLQLGFIKWLEQWGTDATISGCRISIKKQGSSLGAVFAKGSFQIRPTDVEGAVDAVA